ncbi:hypothetical protein, partial [Falsihalocynthiibacter sp. CO-5D18]|uniref:hypothetical protein n=1 Tax=Falsihalocynthiibacter sp. CO-5D18 TaxID=3240872 RepID=UPI00350FF8E7
FIRCLAGDAGIAERKGQRSHAPRQQAGHMTATCNDQNQLKSILAKQGPSTHDTTVACVGYIAHSTTTIRRKADRRVNVSMPSPHNILRQNRRVHAMEIAETNRQASRYRLDLKS